MRKLLAFLAVFCPLAVMADVDVSPNASAGGTVGVPVSGGTASRLMSTDSSGKLQTHSGTQFDGSTVTLQGVALSVVGNVVLSSASVIDVYSDSFGSVTAGSTSTVTWTEVVDRLGEFVTSSFTVTIPGYYEIVAHSGASQTAGTACLILKKNGTSPAGATVCNQGVTGLASVLDVSLTRIMSLVAGDIIRIDAAAVTANATFQKMTMTIKRVP